MAFNALRIGCRIPHQKAAHVQNPVWGAKEPAAKLAADQRGHVNALRTALGPAAIACPKADLDASWAHGAAESPGVSNPRFTPYRNDLWFLFAAFVLENVAATAYNDATYAASLLLPPRAPPFLHPVALHVVRVLHAVDCALDS